MRRFVAQAVRASALGALVLSISSCVGPSHLNDIPPTAAATETYSVYVADSGSNDVTVIDASGKIVKTVPVGRSPAAIAFDAQGNAVPKHVYIANRGDNTVTVLNASDNTVAATIPVGLSPSAIAFASETAGNDAIFVANSGDGTVSRIDVPTLTVTATYKTGRNPVDIATEAGEIGVLNLDDGTVAVVDTTLQKIRALLPVTGTPIGVTVSSQGYTAASSDGALQPFTYNNTTGAYDAGPMVITGAAAQHAVTFDRTTWAFVNSQNGTVAVYDAFAKKITQTLTAGNTPVTAAVVGTDTAGAPINLYVPNKGSDTVSWYSGTDFSVPFTAHVPIALAKGSQPVAVGFYMFWTGGASSPSPAPSSTPTVAPTSTPTPAPTATPTAAPTATPAVSNLYVANYGSSAVTQYAPPFSGASAPAVSIPDTSLLGGPIGVAVDSSYVVTSHASGSVNVYAQPVGVSSSPAATFGAAAAGLLAFDPSGNLWATSQNTSVVEYIPPFTNSTTEAVFLTNGFSKAYGITFDGSGNMYVTNADSSASIVVYAPPYGTMTATHVVPGSNVGLHGIAVNGSSLYVADTHNNLIYVYTLPMTTNIPADAFSATAPLGLAFDAGGKLYVTSQGTNQVQIFNPPFNSGSTPAVTVTSGISGAYGIATGR